MEFNEQKAIDYIKQQLPADAAAKYEDDEILNVIDIIFDFYEDNGMLDVNCEEDDDDTILGQMVEYVTNMLKKDPYSTIESQHIETIVKAELEYEESICFDDL